MKPIDQLEVLEKVASTMPEPAWYRRLRAGGDAPLPPRSDDGWGRWWDRHGDIIWLLLVALGLEMLCIELMRESRED